MTGLGSAYGGAIGDMASGKYPDWSVGINFSYPIGNSAAEADLASNRLKAAQSRAGLKAAEESVGLEVRSALRALEPRLRQIEVARKGVTVAEVRVRFLREASAAGAGADQVAAGGKKAQMLLARQTFADYIMQQFTTPTTRDIISLVPKKQVLQMLTLMYLVLVLCWWGFALYIHLRRSYFT